MLLITVHIIMLLITVHIIMLLITVHIIMLLIIMLGVHKHEWLTIISLDPRPNP